MSDRREVDLDGLVRSQEERAGILFVVSAPSGTGKTSLCRGVTKVCDSVVNSVSCTTRPCRDGEREGVDYLFISDEEFDRGVEAGEFAEWAVVHGYRYGTPLKPLEAAIAEGKDVTLAIDVQGARQIRRRFQGTVSVFLVTPSMEELRNRLARRGGQPSEELEQRLRVAVAELQYSKEYNYIVVNRFLDSAIDQFKSIIIAERCKADRIVGG